ncbi:MAG: ATP-dependent zinc metalloprotease FtsH [Dialister sp.]|nr:ATP-dependent zinc metalloprotease FtsH [Dialister sp.]
MEARDSFKSRLGFILVSAGCAIGIGNVWRFPYVTGEYGGAVFVLFYLLFLVILGIPVVTMELAVGRASRKSVKEGFMKLEPPGTWWHLHGWIALAGSFVLMIYYTTISGWMVDYFVRFLDGSFQGLSTKEVADVFGSMLANPTELLGFMGLNVLIGFAVCAGGVAKSLEKVTKVMMLGLLFLIVILAGNSLLLPGAEEGLRFYLLPDWDRAAAAGLGNVASAAMFQAFFTLSVGQGGMEIFASYMSKDNSLTGEAVRITILDTFVAIMAGIIIFPACFAFGVAPAEGPSLIFVALPNIFINMPMGQLWGGLFFLFMTFASFSTVTAVFESLIGNCMDNFGWSRKKSVLILLPLVFFGSIPCVLGFNVWQDVHLLGARGILDTEDFFVSSLVLPGGSLLFVLFCTTRYGWGFDKYMAEVNMGTGVKMPRWVKPYFKYVLPILIFFGIGHYMNKRLMKNMGGPGAMQFGMGKSNAKIFVKPTNGIKFSDVAGEDEAKDSLQEVVEYLHDPTKYRDIGAKMPKGILLVGPPGTGKTMLAKAVAGESEVPFFSISGSEFVEMFVGMGAAKVRDLFKQAKEKAPCIVFIDEIDAIGKKRGGGALGGNDEREQTLNQLLTEMDGFEDNAGVIILAATNRPESLDPALTRPGRFDRQVPVTLPDLQGRVAILKVHAAKIKTAPSIDYDKVARMASGASGAELANIVNEAALRAVRDHRPYATQEDMEESIEVVIAGYQKKHAILTDKEKCIVSYHEIGHALVAALASHSAPVQKITIIPRTSGALGYTMQVEQGNHYLMNKEEMLDQIATLTGGRAAEEVVFGTSTNGASNDIEKATRLARAMITRYGMSDEFGMVAMENVTNQYLGGDTTLACSPETQARIDKAVSDLIKTQHEKARRLLEEHRKKLDELAKYLYEKETITGEQFMEILEKKAE